jgi:tRNA-modifying protein YgfZ
MIRTGARPAGIAALGALCLESGIPRYGSDFDENMHALELGLSRAISFTKGCYVGQESVARLKASGRISRNLTPLFIRGSVPLPAGTRLMDSAGSDAGFVTSSIYSPTLKTPIALGYVSPDYVAAGSVLLERNSNTSVVVADSFRAGSLSRHG